jgi:thioesterase domain-containing protein
MGNIIQRLYPGKRQATSDPAYPEWITEMPESFQSVTKNNYLLQKKYITIPYKGNIVLFLSYHTRDSIMDSIYFSPSMGWEKYVEGNIKTYIVPGEHTSMILPPNVIELARAVEECLEWGEARI